MMTVHLLSKDTAEQPINKPVVFETTCWVYSSHPIPSFFDITAWRESDNEIYKLAFYQLEYFVGFKTLRSGNNCYLKINFDCGAFRNEAVELSFRFDNGQYIVWPAHACKPGAIVKRVTLQTLPWLIPDLLLENLRLALCNYRKIRDRGTHARTVTCAYMGTAYAVLDRALESSQLELVHILP